MVKGRQNEKNKKIAESPKKKILQNKLIYCNTNIVMRTNINVFKK